MTPKLPPPPRIAQNRSGFSLGARPAHLPVGGDDLDCAEIVGGEAVAAADPAEATAEREAGDAGRRDDPARHDQPERLRGAVDVDPGGAGLHLHLAGRRIHLDLLVRREVDHHAAVAQRRAGDVVATAADRQRQAAVAGEPDALGDVTGVARPDDQGRAPLDHGVPDPARLGVAGVPGPARRTAQASGEGLETVAVPDDGRGGNGRGVGHGSAPDNALAETRRPGRACGDGKQPPRMRRR